MKNKLQRSKNFYYRPEIDGLRAIAVISVILYHSKFSVFGKDLFKGGFIGVDIFFVISGYLITSILLKELKINGTISFFNFYLRRARRILPMLLLIIIIFIPFGWKSLLPVNFVEFAQSIIASLFMSSNFIFYFNSTEYSATSALLKPFLHTWSLSIEEQFYLIFPALLLFVNRYLKSSSLTILILLSLISLLFAILMSYKNPDLNFYILLSRFYEFAIGSILAKEKILLSLKVSCRNQIFSILGLCLLIFSIFFFDSNTPHPSFYTLVPIVGSGLIIVFASKKDLVGKLLATKPFTLIGLISYSAYLWHYPIFAFERISLKVMTNLDKLTIIFITIVLSISSYFLIERNFRDKNLINNKSLFFILAILMTIITILCLSIIKNNGYNSRLDKIYSIGAQKYEKNINYEKQINASSSHNLKKEIILIIGDSYSENWGVLGKYISERFKVINLSYLGCNIEIDKNSLEKVKLIEKDYKKNCKSVIDFVSDKEQIKNVASIILTSYRPFFYQANNFRFDLIKYIKDNSPSAEVFIMGNYFQLNSEYIDSCLNLMFQLSSPSAKICLEKSTQYNPQLEEHELSNKLIDPSNLNYKYVSIFDVLRNNDGSYPYEYNGVPFTIDWNHMTKAIIELFSIKLYEYNGYDNSILKLKNLLSR